jgi:hypothetical protein
MRAHQLLVELCGGANKVAAALLLSHGQVTQVHRLLQLKQLCALSFMFWYGVSHGKRCRMIETHTDTDTDTDTHTHTHTRIRTFGGLCLGLGDALLLQPLALLLGLEALALFGRQILALEHLQGGGPQARIFVALACERGFLQGLGVVEVKLAPRGRKLLCRPKLQVCLSHRSATRGIV